MPRVNSTIRRIIREKDSGIKSGIEAMRDILREFQRQTREELGKAALGTWDAYSLKSLLSSLEGQAADLSAKAKGQISGLIDSAWEKGLKLVDDPLAAGGVWTGFGISTSSVESLAMKDFAEHVSERLLGDAWTKVKGELTLGVLGGKTPQEVAKAIGRNLKEPSIFKSLSARAEAITKTEMGKAFSMATQARMTEASEKVEGLEKQWLHAGHPKMPRISHLLAHGQHVPVSEPFLVAGIKMMHPRDPGAPIEEVINCGCDHVPYHEKWN